MTTQNKKKFKQNLNFGSRNDRLTVHSESNRLFKILNIKIVILCY